MPIKLFDPDPNLRWLFCLTHPDDEISIAAWIRKLARSGHSVYLSWTHSMPVREAEAREAARLMGVPDSNLFFHGATDGIVCFEMRGLLPKFQEMVDLVEPHRICCGAFEQGHLDHDATNFLVNQVAKCPILEIPFYHVYTTRLQTLNRFSDPRGEEVLALDREEQAFKKQIARLYPSQNIWQVLVWYEVYQAARLRRMTLSRTERMRLQTRVNFTKPNHPPRISAKVLRSNPWRTWRKALRLYRLSLNEHDERSASGDAMAAGPT